MNLRSVVRIDLFGKPEAAFAAESASPENVIASRKSLLGLQLRNHIDLLGHAQSARQLSLPGKRH